MKVKLIAGLLLGAALTGCTGAAELLDFVVAPSAKEVYEAARGTEIVLTDSGAAATSTVMPIVDGANIKIPLADCDMNLDLSLHTEDYLFWIAQPVTLNYDPSMTCVSTYTCDWAADMNGTVAEVEYTCVSN